VYRAGIIGLGWIAVDAPDNHAQAYIDCPNTSLMATCDTDIHKSFGQGSYKSYKKMVKEANLDIVSVCTPVETHCKIVCDIAPHVKAIYCEKPMATTLGECDKMIEICKKHNVILQINHQRRFAKPRLKFSRDIIDTGTHAFDLIVQIFGEIDHIHPDGKYVCVHGNPYCKTIELEYIPTMDKHVFELDCVRTKEKMIIKGIEHLVACLDSGRKSYSSGEDGREALKWALKYKELIDAK